MRENALDPAFERAMIHFNEHAFFEAHEDWEALWLRLPASDARAFVQGLIQIAAGFHKLLSVKQPASAVRLLSRGVAKVRTHASGNPGIDADELCAGVARCIGAVGHGPPERAGADASFDRALLPRVLPRA